MKLLLLILLISSSYAQTADKLCVVVSGKDKDDDRNFLDEELFKSGQSVAGVPCKVFGNWDSANWYVKKNLKKGGNLLMVQGAHGITSDGSITYDLNEGTTTSEKIYSTLKNLSKDYQVGSVIHSCFSAEILKLKLLDDEKSDVGLDKLCLVSSSSFGRITKSKPTDIIQNLLKMRPGESLEKAFINNHGGVISSAAWSEVGLPQYLMADTTANGFDTLEKMNGIMKGDAKCDSLALSNASMCLAPSITDTTYEDVMSFMDPIIMDDRREYFLTNFKSKIGALKNMPSKKNELDCREGILKAFTNRFGSNLNEAIYFPQVMYFSDEVKKMTFYKDSCVKYLATEKDSQKKKSLVTESFETGISEYRQSLDRLERKYSKKNFDSQFDIQKFASDALGEKKSCNPSEREKMLESKQTIIQSLFGTGFFNGETYSNSKWSAPAEWQGVNVSTQVLLKGFQNSALLKPTLVNKKDQLRRKACQDFKF